MKTSREAAARAVCLGAIEFRSRFEGAGSDGQVDKAEAMAMACGVTEWLREARLWSSLIEPERHLMELAPLTWERSTVRSVQQAELSESTGVLLTMLRQFRSLPAYDEAHDVDSLLHTLPFLSDSPFVTRADMAPLEEWQSMAESVELVPAPAVASAERIASLWWWRATSESLVRAGRLSRHRLGVILEEAAARARELEIPFDGDFVAFARPYSDLTTEQHAAVSRIAEARVRACRWLLGDVDWDEVPMGS